MKKLFAILPIILLLGCIGGYNVEKGLGKLHEIQEKYVAEEDWGPVGSDVEAGLAELQTLEQELLGYEGDRNAEAVLYMVKAFEKVYAAKLDLGNYDRYEPDDYFCSEVGDIIVAYTSAAAKLKEASAYAGTAATDYSKNLGDFVENAQELSSTYLWIAEIMEDEVIPTYQSIYERSC